MSDAPSAAEHQSKCKREIANDLRNCANAGMDPVLASKLRAAAAELDALAAPQDADEYA